MPRPKKPGSAEPKTRSRHGCWPCKNRKIKCGEEKPHCLNCQRNGEKCDYSIVLNWQGRNKKGGSPGSNMLGASSFSTMQYNPESQARKPQPPKSSPPGLTPQMGFDGANQIQPKRDFRGAFNEYGDASRAAGDSNDFNPPQHRPLEPGTTRNIDPSLNRIRALNAESYPSPAETNVGSPPGSGFPIAPNSMIQPPNPADPMPPPIPGLPYHSLPTPSSTSFGHSRQTSADEQGLKRVRLSPASEHFEPQYLPQPENVNGYFSTPNYTPRPRPASLNPSLPYSPSSIVSRIPPTPAASIGSDDNHTSQAKPSPHRIDSPNTRRVSIQSLVSGNSPSVSPREDAMPRRISDNSNDLFEKKTYGFDLGVHDIDIPENKDHDALSPYTPKKLDSSGSTPGMEFALDECYSEFGFTLDAPMDFQQQVQQEAKSYYTRPVKVEISVAFGALPPELSNNPMNLLYFHHFVNHTARILVPYDCSENPFKTLLPKMALQDSTLLHLLLAYSAKHRARLLHHSEPVNRIAEWMQDVLARLIEAVGKPAHEISDSNLATAIMLASLEIISPAPETDEIKISWQKHLEVARKMMLARSESNLVSHHGEINHFLTRWFAYLDVLGSLSGSGQKPLFHGNYFKEDDEDSTAIYQIDCLMGFTSRCVSILARVAELAHQCDNDRLDPENGHPIHDWQPSATTIAEAQAIKSDLHKARQHVQQGCHHRRNSATDHADPSYAVELVTTNDAFHWAGLIQLDRRVLGKPATDFEVQFYVREIVAALTKIRPGGTAEACLLFPMFTAGCDAMDSDRKPIMERLKSVERSGMFQVRQAISLVEKVWDTGRSWETFLGEVQFIG